MIGLIYKSLCLSGAECAFLTPVCILVPCILYSDFSSLDSHLKIKPISKSSSRPVTWNRTESPEIDSRLCGQLVFDKGGQGVQVEHIQSSINGVGKAGLVHK